MTMAPWNNYTFEFEFGNNCTYSPAPELGLSHVSHSHEVFNITPQSDVLWEPEYESEDNNYITLYYCCSSSFMFYIKLLSPLWVADLVETHRLLRPVLYQLPDPVGPHQFTQPVITGSLTWPNLWPVPWTCTTIHRESQLFFFMWPVLATPVFYLSHNM